jgi:MFS family permease
MDTASADDQEPDGGGRPAEAGATGPALPPSAAGTPTVPDAPTVGDDFPDAVKRRGMIWAVIVSVFNMLTVQCFAGDLLKLYAIRLGVEPRTFGTIVMCLQWAALARLPAAARVNRRGKKKILMTEWGLCTLAALLIVLAPQMQDWFGDAVAGVPVLAPVLRYLSPERPEVAVALLAVLLGATTFNLLQQGGGAGWFPLLQDVVPTGIRGRFFGLLRTTWQTTTNLFLLFATWFLGAAPAIWQFQALLGFGVFCTAARVGGIAPIPERKRPPMPAEPFWKQMKIPLADRRFRTFLLFTCSYYFCWGMIEPFRLVYLNELGFSNKIMTLCAAFTSLGAIASLVAWGRLADRHGSRPVFGICNAAMMATATSWWMLAAVAPGRTGEVRGEETWTAWIMVLGLFLLMGVFDAGFALAQTRQIMDLVPADNQAIYFSMNTVAIMGPAGLGAFLAGHFTYGFESAARSWLGLGLDVYQWLFGVAVLLMFVPLSLNGRAAQAWETPTRALLGRLFSRSGEPPKIARPESEKHV